MYNEKYDVLSITNRIFECLKKAHDEEIVNVLMEFDSKVVAEVKGEPYIISQVKMLACKGVFALQPLGSARKMLRFP